MANQGKSVTHLRSFKGEKRYSNGDPGFNPKFKGLRRQVTASQLLEAEIIEKELFDQLNEGTVTVQEVNKMDSVQKYLQGTNSIAGVLVQSTTEKMSIYQAMRKGILRPGTALVLLEAQAATGFLIDPVKNKKMSVEQAVAEGLVGTELKDKLLSAERAVTGYTDPYTKKTISLFQALKKDLIVKDHGIRLLEAQIATGGIIDPINSHRVPVEVAYKRGYFDKEMSVILSDPSDDTKGFFDPNTHENLTYLQLLERGVKDPQTGLCLLTLVKKGEQYVYNDEQMQTALKSATTSKVAGKYKGQTVSIWELLYSEYITEEKRRELLQQHKSGSLTIQQFTETIITTVEQSIKTTTTKTVTDSQFKGLRRQVTASQLLEAEIIEKELFDQLNEGTVTVQEVSKMDSVQKYLQGTNSIAGVLVQSTTEKMSIYQAMRKGILRPGTALVLLEAQAATGFLIDPVKNKKMSVEQAVAEGLVGTELKDKLLSAERAVTGYTDPYTKKTISLFQALKKDLIVKDHGIRLLEAQIATGGIIDPINSHRVPVEVAYKRGYFDKEMSVILSDPSDDTKGFFDPNTHENLTYLQLLERGVKDPQTGLCLLTLVKKGEQYVYNDEQMQTALKSATTSKVAGKYKGQTVSIWELLYSEYITEEKRRELLQQHKSGSLTIQQFTETIITTVEQSIKTTTTKTVTDSQFKGLRRQVTASQLLEAEIIEKELFDQLNEGTVTVQEVSKMDSVQKYLQGTNSIAGVLVQSTTEKMSIYQAMRKGILRPGTALVLLEAQAATGFLIDPVKNKKMSVEQAVAEGLVGTELKDKLLSAERAVTGYTDPYTKKTISLFQALKKDLIVKDHGIRLLEAQIATGGIIDPINSHRVPVEVAYKRGYFDKEMSVILSDPSDDTKGFFDPNTHENLTYLQLLERGVKDPQTGLCLLTLVKKGEQYVYNDEQMQTALKSATTSKVAGKYKGQTVSIWELLYSEYITEEKRRELLQQHKSGSLTIQQFTETIITTVEQSIKTTTTKTVTDSQFKGLRRQVTASQLLEAEIIEKELFDQLNEGTVTVQEVSKMDSVQKYLQGTNSIAGVLVQSTTEKMSIYQAMRKGILRPGTALVLLEAQAATGFLIDPVKNKKMSVEQAVAEGLVGTELKDKLLSAERAVTGYTDPYTKKTISLFQALKKDLIVKDHGIRLLEAQIATGGIIDPINSHRVPVEVAYKRGYFDKEMSVILSDPSDDTKGFFDPNTHENLTYLQLLERGVKDPQTGLCLLTLVKKGEQYVYNDEQMQTALKSATTSKVAGKYKGQTVSIWELLYSEYITEEKRRELLQQHKSGSLTIQQFTETIITTVEQSIKTTTTKTVTDSQFKGLRRQVTASQLLEAEIIEKELFDQLNEGTVTVQEVSKMDSVQKYLQGTNSIAGVLVQSTTEKMSIYQAMRKGILRPGTALVLLEAQAATGFLIDPVKNKKMSVEQAVAEGLVGTELKDKLLSAERAVTGYTDPYTKKTISLFQALKKDLIVKDHGIRLLEAQIATGGIIDPINSHRVPVEVAYKRGYFDKEMSVILSDPSDDTKGFFDPNTHENLTYLQLLERGVKDPQTGLCLLTLVKKGEQYVYNDEQMQTALKSATTSKVAGKYKGQTVSIWELLYSEYITEEKRRELLQQHKSGSLTIQQFTETIITTVEQSIKTTTTKTVTDSQFKGLRRQVTASQLLEAEIIEKELFDQLNEGTVTVQEVSKMDSVQKYLQGTNSIAGVLVQSTTEKMSIYQAMRKGILRPGTALVLLEAQAATGFLIDPVKNKKMSVEQAVAEGLVGTELKDKLLSAERAVTGYTDPYTKKTISLFQALKKDLIVKDHGIRLLEAQIATGGIIDPINSHRVPVEVAYKRGYFDKEMSVILSDPSDDTKGFFDPNTHENLTYLQLLERGVKDPQTGLCLLTLVKKGEQYVYNDEQMQTALKSATTSKVAGKYKGQTVSIWELLYSEYITEEKRRELLQQHKSGSLTIQQFTETIITTVEQSIKTTTTKTVTDSQFKGLRRQVTASQLLEAEIIEKELFDQLNEGTVTVQEVSKMDSVQKYLQGTNSIAGVLVQSTTEKMSIYQAMRKGILRPGTALVLLEAQAATGFLIDPVKNKKMSVEQAVAEGLVGTELKDKLLSAERAVTGYTDPYTKKTISLFQALKKDLIVKDHGIRLLEAQIATGGIIDPINSHRVPVEVAYKRGYFDKEMSVILSDPSDDTKGFFDPNTHENLTYLQLLERGVKDPQTGLCLLTLVKKGEQYVYNDEQMQTALKSATTSKVAGKYKGQTVSIWELLYSEYITEEKRRELLQQHKSGSLTIQQFTETIITTVEQSIKTTTTKTVTDSQFKGLRRQVTASQLLEAEIIEKELFDQLNEGTVTVQEVSKMDSVQKYLQGTNSIAGVLVQSTTEKMSIYQAMRKGILRPGTALVLLEAQAATGFLIDPVKNKKMSVEQAVAEGLVGTELKDKLLSAERAVTGYTDPYTKKTISLFQALKKDLIVKDHGIRLLEAQIATGGIIDPINSHRVPVEVAYKRGYFDKEMSVILSDPSDDTKGFFDPNTHENLTYLQLLERGVKDPQTGLCLLTLVKKGEQYVYNDEQMQTALKSATTSKVAGKYKGQTVSIWELLYSEYITEEKRRELLQQHKSGSLTIQQFTETIITTVEQSIKTTTTKTVTDSQFKGLRRQVTASQLLEAEIIEKELFDQLNEGTVTVQEVSKMDSVQKYLQGTNSIAGVLVQSTTEKMSIYQAMRKGILRPGTALVLLEAQAATGFLIDPVKNKKMSVEQAVAEGLVGTELKDKLLSAERAVTGYTDPYTKKTISLFQALKKDLIVKDHGIRLLEAQIATGGIIDPINSHRVPVEVAYKRGYFDKEMSVILSDPSDDTKGFFDPNTHENLTYLQLLERGVKDPQTGLCLLTLVKKGEQYVYNDEQMQTALKSATTSKVAGKYKGQTVSIWELLYSEYITEEKRRELLQQHKSGSLTIQQFTETIITTVEQSIKTTTTKTVTDSQFKGLRRQVTASQLLEAEIIEKELFDQLNEGTVTVQEVSKMDSVQKYLQGTNSIAGVLVQSTTEKMSIYQAMRKGILRPGTALVLLEAQAATGFLIDPVKNKKMSVEQAVAEGLVGTELKDKLLSAERAVTGYTDPYTKKTISLFQALKKDLIVKDHGIRLLEAQIATGGIIDPINSHRVPVEVAYKRGYFDKEMSVILSDPSDDTKGFFDPNTHENLTYLQLLERGVKDPQTGLCLLTLVKKGEQYVYNDEQMQTALKSATTSKVAGKYKGQTVSIWELLYSEYITEEKRRELLQQHKSGSLTIQQFTETIITTVEQSIKTTTTKTVTDSQFKGLRRQVTASQLLEAEIIEKELFDQLNEGTVTVQEVSKMDSVQKYLQGTNSIAGVLVQSTTEKMSIYQAMRKGILRPGTALVLLEAQAATGFLIDPVKNKKMSVEQAVAEGLVGTELKDKLLSAERAVTGYTDPYTKKTISLFQALKKDLIVKDHGIRLLEAQIATGGIIDPINSHRVPVEVAYKRGYFDKEMSVILSDPSDDTKGFFDPNTHENLTYLQLLERGVKDPQTGLCLLTLVKKGEQYVYNDEQMQTALKSATTSKVAGKYKGQTVSIWELLYSEYITEEKRRELLQQHKSGSLTIQQFTETIITTVEQSIKTTTTKTVTDSQFKGLRRQVTASQLLEAEIIEKELFDQLNEGTVTVQEVSKMDSVQKYLQGTNSIAGVLVQSTTEKMSIYQAMRKGILRPGTALVLLEAQAATGFLIDPVKNKKMSVEQAVAEGLVGTELKDKLLSAERAVTGYTDPYTKKTISLFQALKKDLIVKDHGIRLLEAQIATGGIIDPINSHRVPVEVAYKRGYFDKEMSVILSDPSDDTKGFFDPNTHENLTYLQLLERGVKDPQTGLCLLTLVKKGEQYVYNDEQMQTALKSATTSKVAGKYKGQTVSIWELLYSEYITEEKRRELLQQHKSGSLTIQQFTETIITTVEQSIKTTTTKTVTDSQFKGLRRQVTASQLLEAEIIEKELFDQLNEGTVTVQEVSKMDSVQKYLQGTNSIAGVLVQSTTEKMSIYQAMRKGILRPGTALVLLEAQAATGFLIDPVKNKKMSVEQAVAEGLVGTELKDKLLSAERAVTGYTDPYTKKTISLFQALKKDLIVKDHGIRLLEAQIATGGIIDPINSHRVPVEVAYKRGYFDKEMSVILSDPSDDTKGFFDPNTHENLTYLQLLERGVKDPQTGLCLLTLVKKGEQYVYNDEQMQTALKSATTSKVAGKYKGQTVSIWELLYSEYITEEKRRELLQQHKSGSLTIQQFTETIITTVEQSIKTTTTKTVTDSQFKGLRRQVTASQLLEAEIIEKELFDQLNEGTVTVQEVSKMDSVQKYLQGTNSIAGVLVQSTTEKMSIYQAMRKGILRPGTALVLLEAQAATGFLIDPVKNKKMSVEQAVAEGLVGTELKDKLLSAERAVTGYTDPYTKNTISLFQALKKDLIVKDHGIRLLEAQIATGGIIDPINSHRVPVEVAYKRGYLDKEMSVILSDPSDDTKGFFDPNTHENLTYLQLLERGVKDPQTGLCFLTLKI
ncbi:epiplakin-like [Polyodon spathula]|uniref:epiplakin-like n=1 Tax=Polyodon spathula TaxID=7913 RepID=UPI001B7EFF88|nr:epiplakin-like [Polyodon spathula]